MGPRFSDEEDDILVEEVAKHPPLWQPSDRQYKDQELKDNIWAEISERVGKPVCDCKKRWKNIKVTYDRKMNRKAEPAAQRMKSGKKWILEEKLSFLQSVKEYRGDFSNINTAEEDEFFDDSEEAESNQPHFPDHESLWHYSGQPSSTQLPTSFQFPLQTSFLQSSSRTHEATNSFSRRTSYQQNMFDNLEGKMAEQNELIKNLLSVNQNVDEIDLFFQSIAKSVKKLPRHLQHCAKVETLNMIGKLELGKFNSFQPASSPSPTSNSFSANNGSTENNAQFTS